MNLDTNDFRRVMGHFATGVAIVTTKNNGTYHGLTVNSFTSVSLDPLLVQVNISKHAESHDLIKESGLFAVNLLTSGQEQLSRNFATHKIKDRFAGLTTSEAETGAPIIDGSMAYLDTFVKESIDAGDHTIFIGQVVDQRLFLPDAPPLLYYRGNYANLVPSPPEDVSKLVPRE
jgi:flavin reductase (DIM6/NTAB) family NADH-FMN oxidoreductase RutF